MHRRTAIAEYKSIRSDAKTACDHLHTSREPAGAFSRHPSPPTAFKTAVRSFTKLKAHRTRANIIPFDQQRGRVRTAVGSRLFGFRARLVYCSVKMTPDHNFTAGTTTHSARARRSSKLDRMYVGTRARTERAPRWAAVDLLLKHFSGTSWTLPLWHLGDLLPS
jgi:hypothetical protein